MSDAETRHAMSYDEFWLRYLRAHRSRRTRLLHYLGSVAGLGTLVIAIVTLNWRGFIAAPLIGYGFAWTAHAMIERNSPETFGHPVWSLLSDFRMLALALTARLTPHLQRAGLR